MRKVKKLSMMRAANNSNEEVKAKYDTEAKLLSL